MADSLVTFLPTGSVDPAIELGTEDCWIKVTTNDGLERYEVTATYVRNDPSDKSTNTTGDQRLSAEQYYRDLVASLGGHVPFTNIAVDRESRATFHPKYLSGTLENPYTSLSVEELYFIDSSMSDEGGRSYDMTFVFVKPAKDAPEDNLISFDPVSGSAVNIGNREGWMRIEYDEGRTVVTVNSSVENVDRATAEVYAFGLASSLGVLQFQSREGSLLPQASAVKGTLTNADTGYTLADCYCIGFTTSDEGYNAYTISLVFSTPDADTLDPGDNGIPAWQLSGAGSPTDIGNTAGQLIREDDGAFITYRVTASYIAETFRSYSTVIADALGPSLVSRVRLPDGTGLLKNPCGVTGTLTFDGSTYSNLYFEDIDYDYQDDRVDITATFVGLS